MPFRVVAHFFIPHESNNHRPKALHVDALFAYVLLLLVFNFVIRMLHRSLPDVLGYATDIRVEQLFAATNAKRQEAGLSPLSLNQSLSAAAAKKASDMFAKDYWAHTSPNNKTPWDFLLGEGYQYTLAGENLAKNFSTSKQVVDAWVASPTHRDNINKPGYREIGFAVVNGILNGEETTLVVQMFGTPAPSETMIPSTSEEVRVPVVARAPGLSSSVAPASLGVMKTPRIDIPSVTKNAVSALFGVVVGALLIDGVFVYRRRTVRLTGHNVAHLMFLGTMFSFFTFLPQGTLL